MASFGPFFILFVLIGFFWLGLLTITLCIAVPATGLVLAVASASASPTLMADSFLGLWAGLIIAAGIPYLVKRLFFGWPHRRRKPICRPTRRGRASERKAAGPANAPEHSRRKKLAGSAR